MFGLSVLVGEKIIQLVVTTELVEPGFRPEHPLSEFAICDRVITSVDGLATKRFGS